MAIAIKLEERIFDWKVAGLNSWAGWEKLGCGSEREVSCARWLSVSPKIETFFSGQEGATIDCDEGVPITPFNLEEEMQEGHFDSEGNYFIKKDEQIRDNWLDNIDWVSPFYFNDVAE